MLLKHTAIKQYLKCSYKSPNTLQTSKTQHAGTGSNSDQKEMHVLEQL